MADHEAKAKGSLLGPGGAPGTVLQTVDPSTGGLYSAPPPPPKVPTPQSPAPVVWPKVAKAVDAKTPSVQIAGSTFVISNVKIVARAA